MLLPIGRGAPMITPGGRSGHICSADQTHKLFEHPSFAVDRNLLIFVSMPSLTHSSMLLVCYAMHPFVSTPGRTMQVPTRSRSAQAVSTLPMRPCRGPCPATLDVLSSAGCKASTFSDSHFLRHAGRTTTSPARPRRTPVFPRCAARHSQTASSLRPEDFVRVLRHMGLMSSLRWVGRLLG
jgi:hypothetical protein